MNKSILLQQDLIDQLDANQQEIVRQQLPILSPLTQGILAIYVSCTPEFGLYLGLDYDYLLNSKKIRDQSTYVFQKPQTKSQLEQYTKQTMPLPKLQLTDILYDLLQDNDFNMFEDNNSYLEEYEIDQRDFITLGMVKNPISIIKQNLSSTIKIIDQSTYMGLKENSFEDFHIYYNEKLTATLIILWMIKEQINQKHLRIICYPMMCNFGFKVGEKSFYLNRDAVIDHNSSYHNYPMRPYQSEILDNGRELECQFFNNRPASYICKESHAIDFQSKKWENKIHETETPEHDLGQLNTIHEEQIIRFLKDQKEDQNEQTSYDQEEQIYEQVDNQSINNCRCTFVLQETPFDQYINLRCPANHRITGQYCEECQGECEWYLHNKEFYCLNCKEIVDGAFIIYDTNYLNFYRHAQQMLLNRYKDKFPLLLSVPMKIRKKEIDKDHVIELSIKGVSLLYLNYFGMTMNLNRGLNLELWDHRSTNYDFMNIIDDDP